MPSALAWLVVAAANVGAAASAADDVKRQKAAEAACRLDGKPVAACVDQMLEVDDYDDAYMRGAARRRALAALEEAREAAEREKCRKRGVRLDSVAIGMPARMALYCGWGRPEDVRRTTTAAGVSEVWLYPGGRSLLFQGGRLVAIRE